MFSASRAGALADEIDFVRLVIEGESTELDKTILERIGDPLVDVIRKAVDHGLELPQTREANGKTPAAF